MPVYSYRCDCELYDIEMSVEEYTRNTDQGYPRPCPMCLKERKRVWSAPNIIFRGSGWAGKD